MSQPRRDENGPDDAAIAIVDISSGPSARARLEEALQESELRFRTLADNAPALIWTSGIDKRCDYFNHTWLAFTGRTLDEEAGDGWTTGVHPDDLERCFEVYSSAFDRREEFSMVYRLRRADGVYRWMQDDGRPRYDLAGEFIGYIGYLLDVSELKQAEQQLLKQASELNDRNSELAKFNRLVVGRELRMIELKREVNELLRKLGEPLRYPSAELCALEGHAADDRSSPDAREVGPSGLHPDRTPALSVALAGRLLTS